MTKIQVSKTLIGNNTHQYTLNMVTLEQDIVIILFYFLAMLCGLWELSSPTRD